jgi:hypothetical protein
MLVQNNFSVDHDGPEPLPSVALSVVAAWCGAGDCPTVYRTDRGTLVVQGYSFNPQDAGVTVPEGERMVEIPAELLAEFAGGTPSTAMGETG